jgi:outer membrane receptor for ferrienterochelin and colicins
LAFENSFLFLPMLAFPSSRGRAAATGRGAGQAPAASTVLAAALVLVASPATADETSADDAGTAVAEPGLDEEVIEVTGRAPTPTQPIEVIDRAAIARANGSTAADVLGRVAGIHTDGPHNARDRAAHVRIRGLDPRYTLVLVDGQRVPARDVHGVVDLSTLPTAAVQRIEVVKGPTAVLLGGDAIAGVVNVVTGGRIEGTELAASAGYGSFATRTAAGHLAVGGDGASLQITAHHETSDGWSDAWDLDRELRQVTAKVDARGTEKSTLTATETLDRGGHELRASQRLMVGRSLKHKQMTRYVEAGTIEGTDLAIDVDSTLSWLRRDEGGRWAATAHLARHDTDKRETRDVTLRQNGRDVGTLWTDERDDVQHWLASARAERRLYRGRHELTAVGEWRSELRDVDNHNQRLTRDPAGVPTGDADFRDPSRIYRVHEAVGSLVVQDDWNAGGRIAATPGIRVDYHQVWGARVCPAAAVAARVDPALTVRYAIGLGYKAPSIESRNRSPVPDLDVNGSRWLAGNPDLVAESSLGQELGAVFEPVIDRAGSRRLLVAASLFRNDFRDKIERETVDDFMSSGLPLEREVNLGRAVTQGVETTAGLDLGLGANYTYLATRNQDTGARLDRTVTHSANLLASYTFAPTRTTLRVTSRWLAHATRVAADGSPRLPVPSVATTDLRVEQALGPHVALSAQLDNLFGATWDRDADGDTDLPPTALFVGVGAHL